MKKTLFIFTLLLTTTSVSAAPPLAKYTPGETIDPNCSPGQTNCDIEFIQGDSTDDAFIDSPTENRVELTSKSDGTPRDAGTEFVVTDDGRVGVGTETPEAIFHTYNATLDEGLLIEREGGKQRNVFQTYSDVSGEEPQFILRHYRGTKAFPAPTLENDELGTFHFSGYNGTKLGSRIGASIYAYADSDYITGGGGRLEFKTRHNTTSALSTKMTIKNDGRIGIGTTDPSDGTSNGGEALNLDVEGAIGATHYCDENGENCYGIQDLVSDVSTEKRVGWTIGSRSDSIGKWAKIMTVDLAGHDSQDGSFLLALSTEETTQAGTALVSIGIRQGSESNYVIKLESVVMNKSNKYVLNSDSIKIVVDEYGGTAEVYIQVSSSHQGYNIYEVASNHEFDSVTYETGATWSSTEPTGNYEAVSEAWDIWADKIEADNLLIENESNAHSYLRVQSENTNTGGYDRPFIDLFGADESGIRMQIEGDASDRFSIGTATSSTAGNTMDEAFFTINSLGNIGIGTKVPSSLLSLRTKSQLDKTLAEDILTLGPSIGSAEDSKGGQYGIRFQDGASSNKAAGIYAVSEDNWSNITGMALYTARGNSSSSYSEKMRITGEGNVGIGTDSPKANLHVNGSINNVAKILIGSKDNAFPEDSLIEMNSAGNANIAGVVLTGGSGNLGAAVWKQTNDGGLRFRDRDADTNNLVNQFPQMILKNGNLGMNTQAPNSKLEVSGGYIELDVSSGQPVATDCDATDEIGRMKMDKTTTDLYLCSASGWVTK